jgi:uncharacterized protein (TIGR02217 family)
LSGHERRNSAWADARLSYDVAPGICSDAELGILLAFFRARRGPAIGFRLRDPFDNSSGGMTKIPSANDQPLGIGDGLKTQFQLIKNYGEEDFAQSRRITRPAENSILIAVNGQISQAWMLVGGGIIAFTVAPPTGAIITAGFLFDVPVRFADDRIEISRFSNEAGEMPSVPLIEIREPA